MSFIREFKEFVMRGNVIDLAVAVVIGAAFGKIVTALVDKIISPLIGVMVGGIDFSKLSLTLKAATVDTAGKEVPAVVIGYGDFLNTILQFIIIAFAIFIIVKMINKVTNKQPLPPETPSEDVLLLREIRDSLKK
ncbi:large-conductance mechanosensitive channel protein MscL [Xylella fastidiosa subsp. morus]|uniref:Large-conductance mechanosensitive channel n=5 Tax=Xylella fastidiosa TaxID=2371 RepID=MSCL_XYLFM|nr:large-conductance mechanosensitive channel protein MscL [Xylella fastidiosa]B0U1E0.1 RecName: Full=Large-conductance mechanosensitive channel [Xylella fastidiosa M12]ERI59535.1 large conductance mechanosensitive channel protein MscL [Xylella fastidiosa subsp. multiplex Griffin-1]ACA11081.1 large-conductance mechanosensitive channel [Xylella fastidiosa M12]AIC09225.1 large conductance mechanosensitive channel protein MscL [Xylella fastidiosa subsp. sandyi Ann-1]AIC13336.1 large conductance m